ncbi:hypothetical protein BLNAU_3032 [Blattamonas nauphoetae]|uniref:Uncharacterized protein n=1 Tax=Blattamonas nauphoetae TaxID=2049346 RepID=A0ABQ9YDY4_9EUKA|nr:hypothetical protein BLNAU_3032 [Blattamonas nauphoetae]
MAPMSSSFLRVARVNERPIPSVPKIREESNEHPTIDTQTDPTRDANDDVSTTPRIDPTSFRIKLFEITTDDSASDSSNGDGEITIALVDGDTSILLEDIVSMLLEIIASFGDLASFFCCLLSAELSISEKSIHFIDNVEFVKENMQLPKSCLLPSSELQFISDWDKVLIPPGNEIDNFSDWFELEKSELGFSTDERRCCDTYEFKQTTMPCRHTRTLCHRHGERCSHLSTLKREGGAVRKELLLLALTRPMQQRQPLLLRSLVPPAPTYRTHHNTRHNPTHHQHSTHTSHNPNNQKCPLGLRGLHNKRLGSDKRGHAGHSIHKQQTHTPFVRGVCDADLQIGLGADPEVYTQIRQYCLYFEVAAVLHQLRLEGTRDLRNGVDVESSHGFEGESDGVRMVNIDDRSCIGFVTLSGKACSFDPPNEMDMGGRGESSGTGRCSADPTTSSSSLLLLRPR